MPPVIFATYVSGLHRDACLLSPAEALLIRILQMDVTNRRLAIADR